MFARTFTNLTTNLPKMVPFFVVRHRSLGVLHPLCATVDVNGILFMLLRVLQQQQHVFAESASLSLRINGFPQCSH